MKNVSENCSIYLKPTKLLPLIDVDFALRKQTISSVRSFDTCNCQLLTGNRPTYGTGTGVTRSTPNNQDTGPIHARNWIAAHCN